MKFEYKSSLQRTMIVYFLMISFASLLVAGEFLLDIRGQALRSELTRNFLGFTTGEMQLEAALQPIQTLGNKALLMVALFLAIVLILLTMFIRNITEPLQHMIETSKAISNGDLSRTVTIRSRNELQEMGTTVNELTSNLQELLLLSKDMCATIDQVTGEAERMLDRDGGAIPGGESLRRELRALGSKSRLMKDIILNCKYYGVER